MSPLVEADWAIARNSCIVIALIAVQYVITTPEVKGLASSRRGETGFAFEIGEIVA